MTFEQYLLQFLDKGVTIEVKNFTTKESMDFLTVCTRVSDKPGYDHLWCISGNDVISYDEFISDD